MYKYVILFGHDYKWLILFMITTNDKNDLSYWTKNLFYIYDYTLCNGVSAAF